MKGILSILDFKEYEVEFDGEIQIANDILDEYRLEKNFLKHEIIEVDSDLIVQHNIDKKYLGYKALIQPTKKSRKT